MTETLREPPRGFSDPGVDDPLRDFMATYFDHDDYATRAMVLDYLDRIAALARSEPPAPEGLTEALRDSAEALVIVFRRYCLREFGRAPLLADFRDMLAEAARLRSSADSGTEGT